MQLTRSFRLVLGKSSFGPALTNSFELLHTQIDTHKTVLYNVQRHAFKYEYVDDSLLGQSSVHIPVYINQRDDSFSSQVLKLKTRLTEKYFIYLYILVNFL